MTHDQKLTLRAHIQANQTVLTFAAGDLTVSAAFAALTQANPGDANVIAEWYSALESPSYLAWKTRVTDKEIHENGFDWTRLDNLSVGKARVWDKIFVDGALNPSKENVRVGIASVWVGTAQDLAVREVVLGHCRRPVRNVEKVFVTATVNGVGTRGSTANPDTLGYEGAVTGGEILDILGIPV